MKADVIVSRLGELTPGDALYLAKALWDRLSPTARLRLMRHVSAEATESYEVEEWVDILTGDEIARAFGPPEPEEAGPVEGS